MTSCTPTKSNLYSDNSLDTIITESALCKFLTFHNPNLTSIFGRFRRLSKDPRLYFIFRNKFNFCGEGLLAPRPTPKLEVRPLSFVRGCLFNIFAATLHSWRPFLCPEPEDAPCCGDRDPFNMEINPITNPNTVYSHSHICDHINYQLFFMGLQHVI
jgi:hypothetical protein